MVFSNVLHFKCDMKIHKSIDIIRAINKHTWIILADFVLTTCVFIRNWLLFVSLDTMSTNAPIHITQHCHVFVFILVICYCLVTPVQSRYLSSEHILSMKEETRGLFRHAWDSYIEYGFPFDEVTPKSCKPYGPDYADVFNIVRNDALGNTSLTVLDNIDTLIIMEQWDELAFVLDYLKATPNLFESNATIQVFETTIRSLGGLMLSHMILEMLRDDPRSKYQHIGCIAEYDGFLLEMALDLGYRLLPAFKTKTKIPVPRINLASGVKGVPFKLQQETCTAGAASPILEFTLLSKLTGDLSFQNYSQQTFWIIWNSKLSLDLVPMSLNPISGVWMDNITGIGASIDSFYEYAAKGSILFQDKNLWAVFSRSYRALLSHLKHWETHGSTGGLMLFANVDVNKGYTLSSWVDLLGAFWPGLQVLTGQVSDAIRSHMLYMKLWNAFDLIPERWDFYMKGDYKIGEKPPGDSSQTSITLEWYPLRPEFIESTYYLYRATRDPMYLHIGASILEDLKGKYKEKCGFSGYQDIRTGEKQDRMETFVMSETLKYLYLLFDEADEVFLHGPLMKGKNWIFSTEAHPMWYDENKSTNKNLRDKLKAPIIDDGPKYELSLFERIKSKYFDSHSELVNIGKMDTGKLPLREVMMPTQLNLDKINVYERKFYQCEVNPLPRSRFTSLAYYRMEELFNSAAIYNYHRPEHLGRKKDFELHHQFFDSYSLVDGGNKLQCNIPQTTEIADLYIGDLGAMPLIEISKIQLFTTAGEAKAYDYWVPELNSVRLRIEKLKAGHIDSNHNLITEEYISQFQMDKKRNQIFGMAHKSTVLENINTDNTTVYRVLQVNGIEIDRNSNIWVQPYMNEVLRYNTRSLRCILQGVHFENVYAWWS